MKGLERAATACRAAASAGGRARRGALAVELERQAEVPDRAEAQALEQLAQGGIPLLVSGQQAGLAGGPALVLVKAMALLSAADRLEAAIGARPVCLFWLEANDHDWSEAATPGFPAAGGSAPAPPDTAGFPVGRTALDETWWGAQRARLEPLFADWEPGDRRLLLECLRGSLAEQSRALLRALFPDSGLLILDPSRAGFRDLAAPFAVRLGELEGEVIEALGRDTRHLLAAGQAAPALVDERPPWFLEDEGRRRRAERGEVMDAARFSPNVLTRPLLQDWLLEPALVFLGPTERRYYAQLEGARALLGQPEPLCLPRPHVQLARAADVAAWRELGADPWAPPQAGRPWPDELLERLPGGAELRSRLGRLERAQSELLALCAGGRPDLEQLARRQEALGEQVRQALRGAHKATHKEELRRLHALAAWQDGAGGPQERHVNGPALIGRMGGRPVLEALRERLDPFVEGQQRFVCDPDLCTCSRES